MIQLSLASKAPLKKSAILVGLVGEDEIADSPSLPTAADLASLAAGAGASAKADSVVRTSGASVGCDVVVFTGIGSDVTPEALRRAAGSAARQLSGIDELTVLLPAADPESLSAIAEGLVYGSYRFARYTTPKPTVSSATIVVADAKDKALKAALARAIVLGESVSLARDLINTAPGDLYPAEFASIATRATKGLKIVVDEYDEKRLAAEGFGGILGVGQGSTRPPRLVTLTYKPRGAVGHVALVGKGITFDSGGLSLKPPKSMETMKSDMSGAAAVLGAVIAAAKLGLSVQVTGYLALAENMPGGAAIRPSDVLVMHGGKTVEVLNTDAEGRLVLADAIDAAAQTKPDAIIDIATLTGAQAMAFGDRVGAVLGDEDVSSDLLGAADTAGEHLWPMPMPEYLGATLKSQVADMANMGVREGGMIVAAHFLKRFTGDVPWAHLDIAGPAFAEKEWGYVTLGGVGFGVRTFVNYLEEMN